MNAEGWFHSSARAVALTDVDFVAMVLPPSRLSRKPADVAATTSLPPPARRETPRARTAPPALRRKLVPPSVDRNSPPAAPSTPSHSEPGVPGSEAMADACSPLVAATPVKLRAPSWLTYTVAPA